MIAYMGNYCDARTQYQLFTYNCLDFAQDIYHQAGLEGDHRHVMHPDGYPFGSAGEVD